MVDATDVRVIRPSATTGMMQTTVHHIVQDDQGFMWFGTAYGLHRYDGYVFKVFVHDPGNPDSLSGVFITALFKDRDGTLWVGCDQFINRFDRATETFVKYPIPFVTHIAQDSAGTLWLSTRTGLYALEPGTGRIRRYSHDPNDASSLSSDAVQSSGEDRRGRFWVATAAGLDEFERRTKTVRLHVPLHAPSQQLSFYEDRFGVFWIFHIARDALAVFDRDTNRLTRYSLLEQQAGDTAVTGVSSMLEDRNGALWLGTHGAGLLRFDREHRRFIRYRNKPADPDSVPQNDIETLFADREGNVWAGLGRLGTIHFATKPLPFTTFLHTPGDPNRPREPFVGAIYEDGEGILWIGAPHALVRVDRKAGSYTGYRRTPGAAADTDVITIREDRSGGLWAGTYGHGLLRFDRRSQQFRTYRHDPADPHSLSSDYVSRLLVDDRGVIWAGTADGLNRFDERTAQFTTYRFDPPGSDTFCIELVEDPDGAIWIGTDSAGLRRFDPTTGTFSRPYRYDATRRDSLSDNRVNSVHFDRSGTMWVGTQNGLNRFNRQTDTFSVYTQRDGLPGNAIGCVLEDATGELWMSTNNGVAAFNPQRKGVRSFSTADGLPGPDLTGWGACFRSSRGEMFFGGFSGATAFYPNEVADPSSAPPVVLTDFRLFGNPVAIGGLALPRAISEASQLALSHNQNVFTLTFAALSYANPATTRYRYRLQGLQQEWTEVGSDQRQATYTTLPSGTYTFRAQAATSRGPWAEPGIVLRIEILPAWYQTIWFRASWAGAFVLLLWAGHRLRLRQLESRLNAGLEARVDERTRIARELHDTLLQSFHGLVLRFQAATLMLADRPADAKQELETAIRLAGQALREGRNAVQNLRSSTVVAHDLAVAIGTLGKELTATQSNDETTTPTVIDVTVRGTPRNLHPIVRDDAYRVAGEAIRNAFRHACARRIEVEIQYEERQLRVRVRDDGKGIAPTVLAGDPPGHFGLRGMRERAERLGGRLDVWSHAGLGSEIELTIPAVSAYATPGLHGRASALSRSTETQV